MGRPRLGLRGLIMLAAIIALAVGWLLVNRPQDSSAPEAGQAPILAAIPSDAILVASVDLAALRATPSGELLLGRGRQAAGLSQLQQLCGHDPIDATDAVALAVPERSDTGFGLYAQGRFDEAALLGCAERVLSKRGGRPVRQPYDGFSVLRDASAKRNAAELATAGDGLVVIAEPAYVRASLSARNSPDGSVAKHPEHNALRTAVGPATLLVSVILSQQLRGTLADELRAQNMADSPFATIRAAALGLRLGERIELHGLLRCEEEARCAEAARMLDQTRRDEAEGRYAKALGVSRLLTQLRIEPQGRDIHLRGDLSLAETSALLDRLALLGQLQGMAPSRPAFPRRPAPIAPPTPLASSATATPPTTAVPSETAAPSAAAPQGTTTPASPLTIPLGPTPSSAPPTPPTPPPAAPRAVPPAPAAPKPPAPAQPPPP